MSHVDVTFCLFRPCPLRPLWQFLLLSLVLSHHVSHTALRLPWYEEAQAHCVHWPRNSRLDSFLENPAIFILQMENQNPKKIQGFAQGKILTPEAPIENSPLDFWVHCSLGSNADLSWEDELPPHIWQRVTTQPCTLTEPMPPRSSRKGLTTDRIFVNVQATSTSSRFYHKHYPGYATAFCNFPLLFWDSAGPCDKP